MKEETIIRKYLEKKWSVRVGEVKLKNGEAEVWFPEKSPQGHYSIFFGSLAVEQMLGRRKQG